MDIQGVTITSGRSRADFSVSSDEIKEKRQAHLASSNLLEKDTGSDKSANSIQAEELIQNIKALAQEGAYSVRFEIDDATQDLVINLIDQETKEVIRQVPSEEILGMRKSLADLRGNLVETES